VVTRTASGRALVRAFLAEIGKPRTTPAEKAAFFDFKARVFVALAERNGDPEAFKAAARARAHRDRILAETATGETLSGGDL
jgi:hypothetical protein